MFTVGVTLYVVYWGYEMIYGRASLTAGAFVWRMLRIWLIYLIAFSWSPFSILVVNVFTSTADGVATAVCSGVGGTGCSSPESAVGSQLSMVFSNGLTAAKTISASGGWGAALSLGLLAIIDIVAVVIFVAVAITLVMIGKVALFVLLGLAPLFIAMALFEFSSTLFTGWLRTCVQYAIVPVIVYGILSFLLTIMNAAIANVAGITDMSSGLTLLGPFLILCVVGVVILLQAVPIAASIAGAVEPHRVLRVRCRIFVLKVLARLSRREQRRQFEIVPQRRRVISLTSPDVPDDVRLRDGFTLGDRSALLERARDLSEACRLVDDERDHLGRFQGVSNASPTRPTPRHASDPIATSRQALRDSSSRR